MAESHLICLAPQVGLEPTTLRLTAPEVRFSGVQRCVATCCDRRRYVAQFLGLNTVQVNVTWAARMCANMRDCYRFLDSVGKEMGKVKRVDPRPEVVAFPPGPKDSWRGRPAFSRSTPKRLWIRESRSAPLPRSSARAWHTSAKRHRVPARFLLRWGLHQRLKTGRSEGRVVF
jgi:hypothetical protein